MIFKIKILTGILSVLLFLICGFGYAESEIPYVFKYSLSSRNNNYQHSAVFNHSKHAMEYKITCVDCHHQLEPGSEAVEENCLDCHGRKAIEKTRSAQHTPNEKGAQPYLIALHAMCIECHKVVKANSSYANIPVACWRCHIRKKR